MGAVAREEKIFPRKKKREMDNNNNNNTDTNDAAKQCPWCKRWSLKDEQCNYVVCGRPEIGRFVLGAGCGRAWCFACEGKLCGRMFCGETGAMLDPNEDHNHNNDPEAKTTCSEEGFCSGGHNSHKD